MLLMGKLTISTGPFSIAMFDITRGYDISYGGISLKYFTGDILESFVHDIFMIIQCGIVMKLPTGTSCVTLRRRSTR